MAFTTKLIEAVKRYPPLYDTVDPDYKNNRRRDLIWQEIGAELGEEGEEIKKKWRNLRDTYAKYLRCMMTNGPGAKRSYKNWQWSDLMCFFRPYLKFNPKIDPNTTNNDTESDPEARLSNVPNCEENSIGESINEEETTQPQNVSVSKPSTSSGKRHRVDDKANDAVTEAFLRYLQTKRSRYQDMSGNELLFLGYAKTLDSFSLRRQACVKMKIAKLFAEEEMQHLEEMDAAMSDPLSSQHSDVCNIVVKEEQMLMPDDLDLKE